MLPLKDYDKVRISYRFGVPTFYNDFHTGTDYIIPVGTPIFAWTDVEIIKTLVGTQGGNTAWVKEGTKIIRLLHLKTLPKLGKYKEGDIVATSGNTGLSTAPHAHIDVSEGSVDLTNNKNFRDPEIYFNQFRENTMELTKDQKKDLTKLGFEFGDNLNSGELDRLIKKALDLQNAPTPPAENCDVYKQQIVEKDARIAELEPKADIGNRFMEVSKMAVQ